MEPGTICGVEDGGAPGTVMTGKLANWPRSRGGDIVITDSQSRGRLLIYTAAAAGH
jgi:hypothetical protein